MSIYDLDLKGIRKTFIEFHQSVYGRTIFLLAYIIPFVLFVVAVLAAIFAFFITSNPNLFNICIVAFFAFFPTFIVGNMYFYGEIRRFCAYRDRCKRRQEKKNSHKH